MTYSIPNRCVTSWKISRPFPHKALLFQGKPPQIFPYETNQPLWSFRHFSLQTCFVMYHQYLISFQNSSPQKNSYTKDIQRPATHTCGKVPKLAPLVDVQRIPKFGYLSHQQCDMTLPGEPFVQSGTRGRSLGGPRIEENPALAAQFGSLVGGQWWEFSARNGILEIPFFSHFSWSFNRKTDEFRKKQYFSPL